MAVSAAVYIVGFNFVEEKSNVTDNGTLFSVEVATRFKADGTAWRDMASVISHRLNVHVRNQSICDGCC